MTSHCTMVRRLAELQHCLLLQHQEKVGEGHLQAGSSGCTELGGHHAGVERHCQRSHQAGCCLAECRCGTWALSDCLHAQVWLAAMFWLCISAGDGGQGQAAGPPSHKLIEGTKALLQVKGRVTGLAWPEFAALVMRGDVQGRVLALACSRLWVMRSSVSVRPAVRAVSASWVAIGRRLESASLLSRPFTLR